LSYRDFFGPKVRYSPEVDAGDHLDHYNSGVVYKNRGMWYMAAREWEAASSMAPRDLSYLHALGLAYAQIQQFDRARATLDKALQLDPNHVQIKESRALVEKMAQRAS
jgi:lipoprotein NlpI